MTNPQDLKLADLPLGRTGVILILEHDEPYRSRLQALGLVPGTVVRAIRSAPLGDPREYELRGARLCVRQSDARLIGIRLTSEES